MKKNFLITAILMMPLLLLPLGCGGDEGSKWEPFDLKAGQYYKYKVRDHSTGTEGWISVRMAEKDGELEGLWEGNVDGTELSAATAGPPGRFIEFSRPALTTTPGAAPLLSSILVSWWENLKGFELKPGAEWSVVLGEMMPASYMVYVEGTCSFAGQDGYSTRFQSGQTLMMEACLSPALGLPLQARTFDVDGNLQYEAQLEAYRSRS